MPFIPDSNPQNGVQGTPVSGSSFVPDSGFESTPGGAAVNNPILSSQRRPRQPVELGPIAGATGMGAVLGGGAAELLTLGAGVARQIPPHGVRIAPILESLAIGAKTAGRPAGIAAGAASGFGAEVAGQIAERQGVGVVGSEAARLAGGAVTALPLKGASWAFDKILKAPALSVSMKLYKEFAKLVRGKMTNTPDSLSKREMDFVEKMSSAIREGEKTNEPLELTFKRLAEAADMKAISGEVEAHNLLSNAVKNNELEMGKAMGNVNYVRTAQNRLKDTADEVLLTGKMQRHNIGDDLETSDIGNALRTKVAEKNTAAIEKRAADYKGLETQRDTLVKGREAAGDRIDSLPEFKQAVAMLKAESAPGKRSKDVSTSFNKILSELELKSPEGEATPNLSFRAVDDVRRKLGEVFKNPNNPPEGYAAIDANTARKYYGMLSNIQKKFVDGNSKDGIQSRLLQSYREGSEGLSMYGSKSGKKLVSLDRWDETKYNIDPSSLPKTFLSSKQGIADLIELTGDRALVVKSAKDYATNSLRDKTSTQAKTWVHSHSELMKSLPEVQKSVNKYVMALDRSELIHRNALKGVDRLSKHEQNVLRNVDKSQLNRTSGAENAASGAITRGSNDAAALVGNKFPVERVTRLIEGGNPQEWRKVAPYLLWGDGKQNLENSIRQVVANKVSKDPSGVSEFFELKIRPALLETKLMDVEKLDDISVKLKAVKSMKIPEPARIKFINQIILQSLAGYGSSVSARAGSGLEKFIPPQRKQNNNRLLDIQTGQ
ncbi:MAG TPA: hypothetical protein VMW01_02650 [Williamwhitmania sp.]|nr:hypothetical protein [Williamwhitmania sp.]